MTSSLSTVDGSVAQATCPDEIQHKSITGVTHRLTPLVSVGSEEGREGRGYYIYTRLFEN